MIRLLDMILCPFFEAISSIYFLFGQISSTNSFPYPLSLEEEQHYMNLYKSGDMEARNILIERNLRLVAHIVKKYSAFGSDNDDLISIGTIGLIKAVSTYNQQKGTRLATYAAKCIRNEILMQIRSTKKLQNEVSLHETIGVDKEGKEVSLMDVISDKSESVFDRLDLKMQIKKLYDKMKKVLNTREKLIIGLRYGIINGKNKTQREVAKTIGISRSYVSRIEKRAVKKLCSDK